jgi:hypothetical protein
MAAWDADRRAQEVREATEPSGMSLPASWYRETLADFRDHLQTPEKVMVNFSGGLTQECMIMTRPNGPYQVVYLPSAGYFSLCVQSQFGPLDIGIHGKAIGCFGSI